MLQIGQAYGCVLFFLTAILTSSSKAENSPDPIVMSGRVPMPRSLRHSECLDFNGGDESPSLNCDTSETIFSARVHHGDKPTSPTQHIVYNFSHTTTEMLNGTLQVRKTVLEYDVEHHVAFALGDTDRLPGRKLAFCMTDSIVILFKYREDMLAARSVLLGNDESAPLKPLLFVHPTDGVGCNTSHIRELTMLPPEESHALISEQRRLLTASWRYARSHPSQFAHLPPDDAFAFRGGGLAFRTRRRSLLHVFKNAHVHFYTNHSHEQVRALPISKSWMAAQMAALSASDSVIQDPVSGAGNEEQAESHEEGTFRFLLSSPSSPPLQRFKFYVVNKNNINMIDASALPSEHRIRRGLFDLAVSLYQSTVQAVTTVYSISVGVLQLAFTGALTVDQSNFSSYS